MIERLGIADAIKIGEGVDKVAEEYILFTYTDGYGEAFCAAGDVISNQYNVPFLYKFEDEATASLDAENETQIQEAISKLIKNKTVLIIAHRMRTVTNADKIVVLKDGKVTEMGTPNELLEKNSIFKEMVSKQKASLEWNIV